MKAPLVVGLCIFAAGLAGAVVVGRPAARAPKKIWNPWAAVALHEFEYLSEECQDLLEELESEAEEQGRTHEVDSSGNGTLDCKKSEQVCIFHASMYGENINASKCFPAVCKQENIFKELELDMEDVPEEAGLSGLTVNCVSSGEGETTTREPWAQYLSDECHDRLVKLEEEAEKEMRQHEGEGEVECKESEQVCNVSFSHMGQSTSVSKCFPAVCKQENIFKGLEEVTSYASDAYQITGLKVSCRETWEQYLSHHCHDSLVKLEKKAEKNMRRHEADSAEDLDCKKGEQACTVSFSVEGQSGSASK